MNSALMTVHC